MKTLVTQWMDVHDCRFSRRQRARREWSLNVSLLRLASDETKEGDKKSFSECESQHGREGLSLSAGVRPSRNV